MYHKAIAGTDLWAFNLSIIAVSGKKTSDFYEEQEVTFVCRVSLFFCPDAACFVLCFSFFDFIFYLSFCCFLP
jgi:hypothetical protein